MLAEQFLAGSYQSHCAHHETTSSTRFRPMRLTLNDNYRDRNKQHTNKKEHINRKEYKTAHKNIQRHAVHTQLNKDSKQLSTTPPKIAEEEQTLPRIVRIRLAQLRTGYFPLLNSYFIRICDNVDKRCPKCDVAPHDVNQIFNCSKNTMDLKLIDLWKRPVEVAKWLDLIPSVLHDHIAQNNPPSFPFSLVDDDAPPGLPNPGIPCHSPRRRCRKVAAPQVNCG